MSVSLIKWVTDILTLYMDNYLSLPETYTTIGVGEWMNNFVTYLMMDVITYAVIQTKGH